MPTHGPDNDISSTWVNGLGYPLVSVPIQTPHSGSIVDYSTLPGPGAQASKMPALDAKMWTLKVALSQRPWSYIASAGMAISFTCNGLTPVLVGRAVDDAIAAQDLRRLGFWILMLLILFLTAISVNWVARYMMVRSQQLVSHDLRTMVTDRIQDPRGFKGRDRTAGGLLSVASSDTQRVGDVVMMTVFPVAEIVSVIYGATLTFLISPWLGLAVLLGGPLLVVIALRTAKPLQKRSVARQQAIAQAAATATDVVQGLRILKGLGAIMTVRGRYEKVSSHAYGKTVIANAAEARLNGVTEASGAIFVSAIGIAAGFLALNGEISIGDLITVVGLTQFLIMPMTMLGRNLASRWASAEASAKRIRAVLGADYERTGELDNARASQLISQLPAGLSTLRAHDSVDYEELIFALESLPRTRVIVAPHAADLFDGTVADNVHPDRAIADEAIQVASCDDIPGGAGKMVGEGGRMLSGGQRQRVALARAIAADAEVLILQDPTTAVDSVTEQNIADQVKAFRGDRITLVFSEAPAWNAVADTQTDTAGLAALLRGFIPAATTAPGDSNQEHNNG